MSRSEEERRTKDSIDFPDKCIADINGALCDGNAVLGGKVREMFGEWMPYAKP